MPFANIHPEHIAIFIPILAVTGGVLIAITAVIISGRKKDLEHRERIAAMEKGLPLPEPPPDRRKPVHSARRAWGLVMTGIGLSVWIGISVSEGGREGIWGLIPLFIGIALLIASVLDKREYEKERARDDAERQANRGASTGGPYPSE
jgi:hypothetical protein